MTIPRKANANDIKEHLRELKAQLWLGPARSWWPDYLFRFDNIDAAAAILNSGKVLSRATAHEHGLIATDSASPEVLAITSDHWKTYVRLYFRPKTPTQYSSEGFRPQGQYSHGAHCPIPIVMLFKASDILTREGTEFSIGNLAAGAATGSDAAFLRRIPFDRVYHNKWFDSDDRDSIIFHRHAEVIIPDEMDLSALHIVGCRTQAEYESFLNLLQPNTQAQWADKIGIGTNVNLYFRYWTFVEQAELSNEKIIVQFNPSSKLPGPFKVSVSITEDASGKEYVWEQTSYMANGTLNLSLAELCHPEAYTVRLSLDDQLAYCNHHEDISVPF